MSGKARSIGVLLVCEVGAMAGWFASAVVVALIRAHRDVPAAQAALLVSGVQAGFVAGTIASAALSLADRFDPRRLFMLSALVAAGASAMLAALPPTGSMQVALRFVTGMCMAGIYPVGMRLAATWARTGVPGNAHRRSDLGLLIGLLVGALTLGSAGPHLLGAIPDLDWRIVYLAAAGLTACCGLAINLAALGPNMTRAASIDLRRVAQAWRTRPLLLANLGYLGHMWELYAMWAWLGAFLQASFLASGMARAAAAAEAAAFCAVAIGALSACAGGLLADRLGRTTITMVAMAVSAACALAIGWLYGGPPALLVAMSLIWGAAVIADSAQFSASIAELAEPASIGTLLTAQTCAGFLLTLVSIHLVPGIAALFGWTAAFSMLAVGPILGCVAMAALRRRPEALRIAGGRR
jgi:MFS family permease